MALTLHFHPLASYCWKVLIALYEHGTPFEGRVVNLGDPEAREEFLELSPMGKIPVLQDGDRVILETSIIIEHLELSHPGAAPFLPSDADARLEARLWDRLFDNYVQTPMQAYVANRLRPDAERDPRGEADPVQALGAAYRMIERHLADGRAWAVGDAFTLADCSAAPALFYARTVAPFAPETAGVAAYFDRLLARPSVARTIAEARPWFGVFPLKDRLEARFL